MCRKQNLHESIIQNVIYCLIYELVSVNILWFWGMICPTMSNHLYLLFKINWLTCYSPSLLQWVPSLSEDTKQLTYSEFLFVYLLVKCTTYLAGKRPSVKDACILLWYTSEGHCSYTLSRNSSPVPEIKNNIIHIFDSWDLSEIDIPDLYRA